MDDRDRINDQTLLKALCAGDKKAFTAIYEAYHANLYVYAFKLVADADEAADIVQDVFIYIWEKRVELLIRGPLLPYLYQCVRHRFLNLTDHRKVQEKFANYVQHGIVNGVDTISSHIAEKELISYLDSVVAGFSKRMGEVFLLKQEGLSNEEIADRLQLSVKTVKNLSSESIKRLKLKLKRIVIVFFSIILLLF